MMIICLTPLVQISIQSVWILVKVKVTGERAVVDKAKPFTSALVEIHLEGDIVPAKALRAAKLSFEQYCSVSMSLRGSMTIEHAVFVNGEKVNDPSDS
jgi:putative redox protein